MEAVNLKLPPIIKGLSYGPVTFYFKNADETPFSLLNWSILAHARREKGDKTKLDLAPEITNPDNGEATLQFTEEETAQMTASDYGWDLLLSDPEGQKSGPYFAGSLPIQELYTRDV